MKIVLTFCVFDCNISYTLDITFLKIINQTIDCETYSVQVRTLSSLLLLQLVKSVIKLWCEKISTKQFKLSSRKCQLLID